MDKRFCRVLSAHRDDMLDYMSRFLILGVKMDVLCSCSLSRALFLTTNYYRFSGYRPNEKEAMFTLMHPTYSVCQNTCTIISPQD